MSSQARAPAVRDYVHAARICVLVPAEDWAFHDALEDELGVLVNAARKAAGLPTLNVREALSVPARYHALDMAIAGQLDHAGRGGRSPSQRISSLDRRLVYTKVLENIGRLENLSADGGNARRLHTALMESPSHRSAILNPDVTHFAVGVAIREDVVWASQLFITQAGELDQDLPLVVQPGDAWPMAASLVDYTLTGWALKTAGGVETIKQRRHRTAPRIPLMSTGNGQLIVQASVPGPVKGSVKVYNLIGPSLTIVPAVD